MRIFVMLVQLGALAYVAIMIVINGGPTDLAQLSFMSAMVFPPIISRLLHRLSYS